MRLTVGDVAIYGTHGIGRITERFESVVVGVRQEVVVLELNDGLRVTLPRARAEERLRPVANEADVQRVGAMLRDDCGLSSDPWLSRRQNTVDKLTKGGLVGLAALVSEGAKREQARESKASKQLSPMEREVFMKARKLLSSELALALDVELAEAEAWIDEQLARPRP